MIGIDSSPDILAAAAALDGTRPGLSFRHGDLASWTSDADVDLVLANASLQWAPDHAGVLGRWRAGLRPGGQLAVQVPANAGQPSHTVAARVAASPRYAAAFGPAGPPADQVAANVLEPEAYAAVLHDLGFAEQHVRLQVYAHVLASTRDVVAWVRGTTLNRFRAVLPADVFEDFVADYEQQLLAEVGDRTPYLFPFRRILLWGRLPR